jgi:sugar lactone lactonase YvrE
MLKENGGEMNYGRELLIAVVACVLGCGGKAVAESDSGSAGSSSSCGVASSGGSGSSGLQPGATLTTLASGQRDPRAISVDATSVYWMNEGTLAGYSADGAVMKMPLNGGTPTTLADGQVGPNQIVVDAANVYWTSATVHTSGGGELDPPLTALSGAVAKVPLGGGAPTTFVSYGNSVTEGIAVDSSNVYWANSGNPESEFSGGTVVKMLLDGGAQVAIASDSEGVDAIAVDSSNVYWTDINGSNVMKAPLVGGTPVTLASGHLANVIAVNVTNVYWADFPTGAVMKTSLAGGPVTTLASGGPSPYGMVLDDANVYWTSFHDGTVMKVPLCGGTATTLVSGQIGPRGIAVDATSVYWANSGCPDDGGVCSGSIVKLTPK